MKGFFIGVNFCLHTATWYIEFKANQQESTLSRARPWIQKPAKTIFPSQSYDVGGYIAGGLVS